MAVERLQKVLAASGVASRRASETLIANGRVTVDGKPAKLGMQVDPDTAVIAVDGRVIGAAAAPEYILLHKPGGVTSTVRDRHASRTVLDMIPTAMLPEGGRLYPVGRLDQDSEGLLVLTNDGAWADRVLHPRHGIEREYAIGLRAPLTGDQVAALKAGIPLEEGLATLTGLRPTTDIETRRLVDVLAPPPGDLVWYRAILAQGWKRQLRRMFGAVGAPIDRLVRVRIGPVRLDELKSGRARRLRGPEVRGLGAGAGTSRAGARNAVAGPD
ncbi:MAG: pseudouridine synthase, partial [Chloroflexota bacterium]